MFHNRIYLQCFLIFVKVLPIVKIDSLRYIYATTIIHTYFINVYTIYYIYKIYWTTVVVQWTNAFALQAEGWVFES